MAVYFTLQVHISGVFILATYLDANNLLTTAKDVVCLLPIWVPRVELDLRPSAGWMKLGRRQIPTKHIKDTEMFSRRFCVMVAAAFVAGDLPWCLIALIVKYYYLPYDISRYTTNVLGGILVVRAWLGPEWVIKMTYAAKWLLTVDMYHRDEIGNAVTAPKTKYLVIYCSIFGAIITAGLMLLFNTKFIEIVAPVSVLVFAFYGLMLAVVQGLPITPNFKLTTLSRGLYIRVHQEELCPCDRRFAHCGDMHTREEILCIFVRDPLTFSELLRGDDTIDA